MFVPSLTAGNDESRTPQRRPLEDTKSEPSLGPSDRSYVLDQFSVSMICAPTIETSTATVLDAIWTSFIEERV